MRANGSSGGYMRGKVRNVNSRIANDRAEIRANRRKMQLNAQDCAHSVSEVSYPGPEDRLVFFTGDVFRDKGAGAFGVAHLAEDAATG